MRSILALAAAIIMGLFGISSMALAGGNPCNPCNPCSMKQHMNPCNPCATKKHMNPCNPCAMKQHMNPCSMKKQHMNPCSMKKQMNPCGMKKQVNPCAMKKTMNPCNPCSMKPVKGEWGTPGNKTIRTHAFDNFRQAAAYGKQLWSDESLGTSGLSCLLCHGDYQLLHLERNQNFPHFVKMVGDVVSLDQMINYCMLNPMKGKQFDKNSKELTAMGAYYRAYRMQYRRDHRK